MAEEHKTPQSHWALPCSSGTPASPPPSAAEPTDATPGTACGTLPVGEQCWLGSNQEQLFPLLSPQPGQAFMTRPRTGALHTRRCPSLPAPCWRASLCSPGQCLPSTHCFPLGHENLWVLLLTNPCPVAAAASPGHCQVSLLRGSAGVPSEPAPLVCYSHSHVLSLLSHSPPGPDSHHSTAPTVPRSA